LEFKLMQFILGILLIAQLSSPPGAPLPQVLTASFKPAAIVKAGQKTDIVVTYTALKGYVYRSPAPDAAQR
jgi:hypothetical protein